MSDAKYGFCTQRRQRRWILWPDCGLPQSVARRVSEGVTTPWRNARTAKYYRTEHGPKRLISPPDVHATQQSQSRSSWTQCRKWDRARAITRPTRFARLTSWPRFSDEKRHSTQTRNRSFVRPEWLVRLGSSGAFGGRSTAHVSVPLITTNCGGRDMRWQTYFQFGIMRCLRTVAHIVARMWA